MFLHSVPSSFDLRLFNALHGTDPDGALTTVMIALTILGSGWMMLGLLPLCAWKRARSLAVALGAVWVATAVGVFAIKRALQRARPCDLSAARALWGETPTDYSFPSGHAAGAFAFAGFVAALCLDDTGARGEAWRWALSGGVFALAAGIAVSRVYLGVHFPTDVMGGAALGVVLGVVGGRVYRRGWH